MKTLLALLFLGAVLSAGAQTVSPITGEKLSVVIRGVALKHATLPQVAKFMEKQSRKLDPSHQGLRFVVLNPKDFQLSTPQPNPRLDVAFNAITLNEMTHYAAYIFGRKIWIINNTILYVPLAADPGKLPAKYTRQR